MCSLAIVCVWHHVLWELCCRGWRCPKRRPHRARRWHLMLMVEHGWPVRRLPHRHAALHRGHVGQRWRKAHRYVSQMQGNWSARRLTHGHANLHCCGCTSARRRRVATRVVRSVPRPPVHSRLRLTGLHHAEWSSRRQKTSDRSTIIIGSYRHRGSTWYRTWY